MKTDSRSIVLASIIALLLPCAFAGCAPGYSCVNNTHYSWCSDNGAHYVLACPMSKTCSLTAKTKFPCDVSNVLSTPYQYNCDPSTCKPPTCVCASRSPPGGLAPSNTPQMVMLTFDDAITPTTYAAVKQILDYGHENPNGCPIRTTWFATGTDTVCDLAYDYAVTRGHEIADHTLNHIGYPAIDEISNMRTLLAQNCAGISESQILGFRAPFLQYSPWSWQGLEALNFSYDCSVPEEAPELGMSIGNKFWPYTMNEGFAGKACWTGVCDYTGKYPNVWSIPMNTVDEYDSSSPFFTRPVGTMDLTFPIDELNEYYTANFNANYYGNRAPFGIWLHAAWFLVEPGRIAWLNSFLSQILSLPDVWVVSGQDVIAYMERPTATGTPPPFFCPGKGPAPIPQPTPQPPGPPSNPEPPATPTPQGPPGTPVPTQSPTCDCPSPTVDDGKDPVKSDANQLHTIISLIFVGLSFLLK